MNSDLDDLTPAQYQSERNLMQPRAAGVEDFLKSPSGQFGIHMLQSQTQPSRSVQEQAIKKRVDKPNVALSKQQLAVHEAKSAARVSQLRKIQQNIEELLTLSNAEQCALSSGMAEVPLKQKYKAETNRLLKDLGSLVKANTRPATADSIPAAVRQRPGTSRVQLRVSNNLARILVAYGKAGQRPSAVVEQTMWKDEELRDAAEILGIEAPALPAPQKRLRRIQPVRQL